MERRKFIEGDSVFSEVQKISPWFALALLFSGAGVGVGVFLMVREIFYSKTAAMGTQILLLLVVLLILGMAISLMFARLEFSITEQGFYFRYLPYQRRFLFIPRTEITSCYVWAIDAFSEYGGVGIKGRKKHMAYTVNNSKGLQIELKNGSRLLIGTEQAQVLSEVIQTYRECHKM